MYHLTFSFSGSLIYIIHGLVIFCNLYQLIFGIGPVWFFSFGMLTLYYCLSQNTGKPTVENVVSKICSQGKPEFQCHLHTVHLYD